MSEFNREDRYIVIKRSDLDKIPNRGVVQQFNGALAKVCAHSCRIPQRRYLVIESDWPEYEPTWAAIESRVAGSSLRSGQGEAVAWRMFDGEDGYQYTEDPETVREWAHYLGGPSDQYKTWIDALYAAPPASADAVSVVLFKTLSDAVSELSDLNNYAREVANDDDNEESQEVCDSTDESIEHMQAVLNKYRALLAQSQGVKP